MNQQQLQLIDYLREENRVLREQLGKQRLRFNDDQPPPIGRQGQGIGKKAAPRGGYDCHARDPARLASPADRAEIRWQPPAGARPAEKIRGDRGSGGAYGKRKRRWGYRRIQGALSNLGYEVGCGTSAEMLARHGVEPAPERERKTTWKEFLTQHWDLIVAADFFTIEAWTRHGLQRFIVLFLMELSSRKVEIAGIAPGPNGLWMNQVGRNLTDAGDGLLNGKRYLIHDRDPLFTTEFLQTLADSGVASMKLPPRSPNLNVYAERL
jgi:hypothetical protein